MKTVFSALMFSLLLVGQQNSLAQNSKTPVEYMGELNQSFAALKEETWQYLKAITGGKGMKKVESKRQSLLNETKTVISQLKAKKTFPTDKGLKNALVDYFGITYIVMNEDFDKILNMEEIAEQSYDLMEAYLLAKEKANEKLNDAFKIVQQAQKEFALQHNITLVESSDKYSEKIQRASEVLKYYNQIHLIFFKCYKQEMYVLDALHKNDVNGLEQNIATLSSFADESIEKLKKAGPFQNDAVLSTAARQLILFYKNEAEKDFPVVVDFYIKKDNFEKLKKLIDSKDKNSLAKEEIDQYNKAIKEYNDAGQNFNRIIASTDKQRSKNLDQWNQKVAQFFENHGN